jgi:hypothetical protein
MHAFHFPHLFFVPLRGEQQYFLHCPLLAYALNHKVL